MNARCPICRNALVEADAVALGAFGKPWFAVHRGPCQTAVQEILRSGALVALGALKNVLKVKAPGALKVAEGAAIGMRLFRDAHTPVVTPTPTMPGGTRA